MSPSRKASNAIFRQWGKDITGHVLSVGSGTDEDKEGGKYRDYFPKATSYTTSEPVPSPHCDAVVDIRHMPDEWEDRYGAIFCSGVLEHVDDVFEAVNECGRVLADGGVLIVGVPLDQPVHRAPQDFWRFTEFGLRFLLNGNFSIDELIAIGKPEYPTTYLARAVRL